MRLAEYGPLRASSSAMLSSSGSVVAVRPRADASAPCAANSATAAPTVAHATAASHAFNQCCSGWRATSGSPALEMTLQEPGGAFNRFAVTEVALSPQLVGKSVVVA